MEFDFTQKFMKYSWQVYDKWTAAAELETSKTYHEWYRSYRIAKSNFLHAYCVLANDLAYREQHDDPLLPTLDQNGRSVLPERDAERDWALYVSPKNGKYKQVRFSTHQEHGMESEYRQQEEYNRGSPWYKPGRYVDAASSGFRNTRDPEAALSAAFSKLWAKTSDDAANAL